MASYLRLVERTEAPDRSVLLVDTNLDLVKGLSETLMNYGFIVHHAVDWSSMTQCLRETEVDLVLMEQRLGRMDMVHHLSTILPLTKAPLVFLADNLSEADRILALERGAADFLIKPISGREIVARIRAHLRRPSAPLRAVETETAGWRMISSERRLYTPTGTAVPLTGTEFSLLEHLVRAAGKPLARDRLTQEVLQRSYRVEDRSIDNLVYQVRQKISRAGGGDIIVAVRGQGYAFTGFGSSLADPGPVISDDNAPA